MSAVGMISAGRFIQPLRFGKMGEPDSVPYKPVSCVAVRERRDADPYVREFGARVGHETIDGSMVRRNWLPVGRRASGFPPPSSGLPVVKASGPLAPAPPIQLLPCTGVVAAAEKLGTAFSPIPSHREDDEGARHLSGKRPWPSTRRRS